MVGTSDNKCNGKPLTDIEKPPTMSVTIKITCALSLLFFPVAARNVSRQAESLHRPEEMFQVRPFSARRAVVIGQEVDACRNDKNQFCGDKVGFGPTLECLELSKGELSLACKTKVEALRSQIDVYHHVCDNSIADICPETPHYENYSAICLMSHLSRLERLCLDYIAGRLVAAFYDISLKDDITCFFLPSYEDNSTSTTKYEETISKVGGPVGAALIAVCLTVFWAIIIVAFVYVYYYQKKRKIAMKARLSAAAASLGHSRPIPMDAFLGRATSQNHELTKTQEQFPGKCSTIVNGSTAPKDTAESHSRAPSDVKILQLDGDTQENRV